LEFAHAKWGNQNKNTNRQASSEDSSEKADEDFLTLDFKEQVRYFAFDSFLGLPDLEEMDLGHSRFRKGR
jgi:hypothetical protein